VDHPDHLCGNAHTYINACRTLCTVTPSGGVAIRILRGMRFTHALLDTPDGCAIGLTECIHQRRFHMGKYFLGWLLGVPVVVLVIIYLLFN
jgi:hypothetical protein